ncbi:MAG: cytochrome c oxidase assembly protein [Ilumatobacter sp.]|uniref:cytochrome c oxidase assembly protein n=1 Tax=Ilumatobacter sp. TaxID=1967498 RepID=UPI00262D5B90|nr:cytochrome c oxidase assembly protein [Ilumatobacter sp.]MDJ0770304.1 cytochrome c oxidase assembly protein [Ilumatobacter sp.]
MAQSHLAAELPVDPLAFQWHPEVWLLVAFLTSAYVYMVRVIGPKAVPDGQPVVSRANVVTFVLAMLTLWIASDWPMHDISEEYLYSAHMVQHMMLSYFLPPLALMATPTWLARVLLGDGSLYRVVQWFAKPVVAGVLFNASVMILHIPLLVNESVVNGPLHYLLHVMVVTTSLLMWTPVCGPVPEFRIGVAGAMIYLFLQSVVPTVPAAWLTFAEGVVYDAYDQPLRLWGISVIDDQQLAGAIMKTAGGLFLWGIVIYLFFKKFAVQHAESYDFRRGARMPDAEIVGHDEEPLTTADVERAFAQSVPPDAP